MQDLSSWTKDGISALGSASSDLWTTREVPSFQSAVSVLLPLSPPRVGPHLPALLLPGRSLRKEIRSCCLLPLRFKLLCKASLQPLLHPEIYVPHPPSSEPCAQLSQRETFPDSPSFLLPLDLGTCCSLCPEDALSTISKSYTISTNSSSSPL